MIQKHLIWMYIFLSFQANAQTFEKKSFTHDGIERSYWIYVPTSYKSENAVPLLMNLHGFGKDGAFAAKHRSFNDIADTANFIVVYPDGTKERLTKQRFWNYGKVMGSTVNDVGFLETLIDTIAAQFNINQKRVYSVGMSNGAFMCYALACQSKRFAAIGAVTGSMSVKMFNSCTPDQPIPIMHIHGSKDPINPYKGNSSSKGILDVVMFWAALNDCTNKMMMKIDDVITTDGVKAEHTVYTNCKNGFTVEHIKIIGGGHTWPGVASKSSLGKSSQDVDATHELWRFLRQFERIQ